MKDVAPVCPKQLRRWWLHTEVKLSQMFQPTQWLACIPIVTLTEKMGDSFKKKTLLVVQEEKIWNFNQSVWEAKRKRSKQKWKLKNLTSQVRQIDNVTSNLRTLQLMSKLRIPPRRCLRVVSAPPLQQSSSSACPTKSLKHCDLHFPAALPPDLKQREVGRVGQHGHSKGFWHKPSQPNVFYIDCTKCKVFMAAAANKWLRSTKAYFSSSMSSRNLILAEWSKSWCHSSLLSF